MKDTHSFLGFTLAELLAVIIIVSILTGLGIGYYGRSVEQSRFSEGISIASAVVEALNRSYLEEQLEGETPTVRPAIGTLGVIVPGAGTCTELNEAEQKYCRATPHFRVFIAVNGAVRAYRGTKDEHKYYIEMHPAYRVGNSTDTNKTYCIAISSYNPTAGQDFCMSMGYTECSHRRCSQPE